MITTLPDFDLRHRNTFRIPCRAERWVEFTSRDDIPAVAAAMAADGQPALVIGGGSNILFTLPCYPGAVVHSAIMALEVTPLGSGRVRISAGSGITMDHLVERTCRAGLWGMENLSAIPGEVGASAVQNVGAYGCEAADIIESVNAFDTHTHRFVSIPAAACRFGYRRSIFKEPDRRGRYIIAGVDFILSADAAPRLSYGNLAEALADTPVITPGAVREAVRATRDTKLPDPDVTGSAGSYFTNPLLSAGQFSHLSLRVSTLFGHDTEIPRFNLPDGRIKVPAAWLIDRAGLKGASAGGAGVWPRQPLVIANMSGHCTSDDILRLERHIVGTVHEIFGVTLTPEVEKAPPVTDMPS